MSLTSKERAEKSAQAMWSGDGASTWLGMELEEVDEGYARLGLTVQRHHTNGHKTCHGGISFSLADSCFAFACNSRNQATVGQHAMISYLKPAFESDRLTAEAREISLTGRSGVYDVRVQNQKGDVIVEFRGMSRAVKGQLFEENTVAAQQG